MEIVPGAALEGGQARHTIDVADETLIFRSVPIEDLKSDGRPACCGRRFRACPAAGSASFFVKRRTAGH